QRGRAPPSRSLERPSRLRPARSNRCPLRSPISFLEVPPRATRRTTSRGSSPATSAVAACSPRSIRRRILERSPTTIRCRRFPDWRAINAQALLVGRITRQSDGRLKAEFRLWDINGGTQLAGQQFITSFDNWRRVAHIISDMVYERLTGDKGYFDTRVVFVD